MTVKVHVFSSLVLNLSDTVLVSLSSDPASPRFSPGIAVQLQSKPFTYGLL
jgi:hypothetical protein